MAVRKEKLGNYLRDTVESELEALSTSTTQELDHILVNVRVHFALLSCLEVGLIVRNMLKTIQTVKTM